MNEKFLKVHQHASDKSLTATQTHALRQFRKIHVMWIMGKYQERDQGSWGMSRIAKLVARELSKVVKHNDQDLLLSFHWSWKFSRWAKYRGQAGEIEAMETGV
jgi:hypothetical protein